jgi:hypothetical protein
MMPERQRQETAASHTPQTHAIRCQGASPDPFQRGQPCGRLLGFFPGRWEFVRLQPHVATVQPGHMYWLCSRPGCRQWNVFRVAAAAESAA